MTVTLSPAPARPRAAARTDGPGPVLRGLLSLPEVRWAAVATALFALGGIAQLLGAPAAVWWAAVSGLLRRAAAGSRRWPGCRRCASRTLDVDLLMIVAALGAAAIGQVFDGALLIVIFATSGALEALATQRTADSVRGLLDLGPEQRHPAGRGRQRGAGRRRRPGGRRPAAGPARASASAPTAASSAGSARSTRPPSPANRCRWRSSPATRCSPAPSTAPARCGSGSTDAVRRVGHRPDRRHGRGGLRDQGADPAVHREGRAALLGRRGRRDAGRCSLSRSRPGRPCSRRCCAR